MSGLFKFLFWNISMGFFITIGGRSLTGSLIERTVGFQTISTFFKGLYLTISLGSKDDSHSWSSVISSDTGKIIGWSIISSRCADRLVDGKRSSSFICCITDLAYKLVLWEIIVSLDALNYSEAFGVSIIGC